MWKPDILTKIQEEYGYKVFSDGAYDLNIIGVRNLENNANQYDDKLHVCYLSEDGHWLEKEDYKACAVYKHPQQARGAYKVGMHRGKYEALVQARAVEYWRDGNKDSKADYGGEVYKDVIGLNIHRSSIHDSDEVNKYSAGCIVFSKMAEWEAFMELVHKQKRIMGYHTFTFTLIAE